MLSYICSILPQCSLQLHSQPLPIYSKKSNWIVVDNVLSSMTIFDAIGMNIEYYMLLYHQVDDINKRNYLINKMCVHGIDFVLAVLDKFTLPLTIIKRMIIHVNSKYRLPQRLAIKYKTLYPSLYKKYINPALVPRDINDIIVYYPEEYTLCGYQCERLSITLITALTGDKTLLTKLYEESRLVLQQDIRIVLRYRIYNDISYNRTNEAAVAFLILKYSKETLIRSPLKISAFVETLRIHCDMATDVDIVVSILQDIDNNWLSILENNLNRFDPIEHWLFMLLISTRLNKVHESVMLDECTACKYFVANRLN